MLLALANVDLPRTIDATAGLVHDFLVYKMYIGIRKRFLFWLFDMSADNVRGV
jgi:hypothetical protein